MCTQLKVLRRAPIEIPALLAHMTAARLTSGRAPLQLALCSLTPGRSFACKLIWLCLPVGIQMESFAPFCANFKFGNPQVAQIRIDVHSGKKSHKMPRQFSHEFPSPAHYSTKINLREVRVAPVTLCSRRRRNADWWLIF